MSSEYKVENDEYYKSFAVQTSRNKRTTEHYQKVLRKFCRATGKTLTEIITTCIDEQSIVTTIKLDPDENGNERKKELKFNINSKDASINIFLNQFEDYCFKRNNKQITIENQTDMVRIFLHANGVELPKRKSYEDDSRDWYLPSKLDFNYLLQDASLVHASLANLLSSSGMRVGDALSLTIGDFMSATADYHDFVDVEEFIDDAPDDMIAQWVFEPGKTRRHHVKCITFSSAHTSNLILQNLRHIKNHYIPYKNDADGLNLSISKKDPLFGSRKKKYKLPPNGKSVASYWIEKNKKFRAWKINQIKQQIENGEISNEDYDEAVSRIPHFHPHVCRKYFITTVSNNCGDVRVSALFEGHSDGLPNDKSYVKKTVADLKEIYVNDIHDALSLDNVETKIISNKETEELNKKVAESDAKIEALTNENAEKDKQIEELTLLVNQTQEQVAKTNKIVEDLQLKRSRTDIRNTITNYFYSNYRDEILQKERRKDGENHIGYKKCTVICELAYEFALENEGNFTENNDYLDSLIKKAIVTCSFNPDMMLPKYDEIHASNIQKIDRNSAIMDIVRDIIGIIGNHEDIWDMVKEDQKTLKDTIVNHIQHSNYDIDNITPEDKQNIAEHVIMDYLTVI